MNYCEVCGITLEMDFNDEFGMVCTQCRIETCVHSHIVDWNEDNNEVPMTLTYGPAVESVNFTLT